eukprot:COSAG02_NODE_6835_length_3337_cov_4.737492_4_plen_121_part_00
MRHWNLQLLLTCNALPAGSRQSLPQYANKWRSAHRLFSSGEAVYMYSTSTRTAFGVSSQPNAPHIIQRSNMQLAVTYNTLLARKALATFALCVSKQMPLQNRPAFATKPSTRPLHGHQSP